MSGWFTAAAAAIGAASNIYSTSQTNAANQQNVANANAFNLYMSNTAHQREVKDLLAAGLNPILSANKTGAVMPPSAIPQQIPFGNPFASATDYYRNIKAGERDAEMTRGQKQVNDAKEKILPGASDLIGKGVDTIAGGAAATGAAVQSATTSVLDWLDDKIGLFGTGKKAADSLSGSSAAGKGPLDSLLDKWSLDLPGRAKAPDKLEAAITNSAGDSVRNDKVGRRAIGQFEGDPRDVLKLVQRIRDPKEQKEAFDAWSDWVKNIKHSKPIRR